MAKMSAKVAPPRPQKQPKLNQREKPANPPTAPSKDLQVFENPAPLRDYVRR